MKNDTTFVCMRSGDITLETQICQKGHLAPSNLTFFLLIAIDRNGFRRMKEEGQIYKTLPGIFKFLLVGT